MCCVSACLRVIKYQVYLSECICTVSIILTYVHYHHNPTHTGSLCLLQIDLHHVSEASFYRAIWSVVDAINDCEWEGLSWPQWDTDYLERIEHGFSLISEGKFRGCVGALDGLAIRIVKPFCSNAGAYFSRKGFFSINCQAIADSNRKFMWASTSATGGSHDSFAWNVTDLSAEIEDGCLNSEREWPFWIACDDAYALTNTMICPFTGSLTPEEDGFNYWQSKNRIVVECAFGMFVGRFGLLWKRLTIGLEKVSPLIHSMMLIHNLCIERKLEVACDQFMVDVDGDRPHMPDGFPEEADDGPIVYTTSGVAASRRARRRLPCNDDEPLSWDNKKNKDRGSARGAYRKTLAERCDRAGLARSTRSAFTRHAASRQFECPDTDSDDADDDSSPE